MATIASSNYVDFLANKGVGNLLTDVNSLNNTDVQNYRSPQELTKRYDERLGEVFFLVRNGVMSVSAFNAIIIEEKLTGIELLYIAFLYLRRNNMSGLFNNLFNCITNTAIKVGSSFICPLLESYNIYQDYYTAKNKNVFLSNVGNYFSSSTNVDYDCEAAKYITVADLMCDALDESEDSGLYDKAIEYANNAIKCNNKYASYYYIRAKLLFLFAQKTDAEIADYEKALEEVKTAIRNEESNENGVQKKAKYLALQAKIYAKITELKIEEAEDRTFKKIAMVEKNSMNKFFAFSAVITFAFGIFTRFLGNPGGSFGESVGVILMIFGLSLAIFALMGNVIKQTIYNYFLRKAGIKEEESKDVQEAEDKAQKKEKLFPKGIILEIVVAILFVVAGALIGRYLS